MLKKKLMITLIISLLILSFIFIVFYNLNNKTHKQDYMHISVDDVNTIFKDLSEKNYDSVWNQPIFAFFKNMHDKYDAVFTLNLFYSDGGTWDLSKMTSKYKTEFEGSSDWLKFAFHAYDNYTNYSDESIKPETALKHYNLIIDSIKNFASTASIDRITRTHFYSGSLDTVKVWNNAEYGLKGFLTADDDRDAMLYLNSSKRKLILENDDYYDKTEGLYFVHTDMRLENTDDPIKMLNSIKKDVKFNNQNKALIIFTHEQYLTADDVMKVKIENCCKWAKKNGYVFDFPEYHG